MVTVIAGAVLVATSSGGTAQASVSFSTTPYPLPFQPSSVFCASPTRCLILGQSAIVGVENGFVGNEITYNGASLADAACPQTESCLAVGWTDGSEAGSEAAVAPLTLGGPGAIHGDLIETVLTGVACGSTTSDCVAIGSNSSGSVVVHIVNGAMQAPTALPDQSLYLEDIACATSTLCVAVGRGGGQAVILPIVDGQPQTLSYFGGAGSGSFDLQGVACPLSNQCYAVGGSGAQGIVVPVSYGGVGRAIAIPAPSGGVSQLTAIACPTSFTCLAVGVDYVPQPQTLTSIAVQILGGRPDQPRPGPALNPSGIACSSSTACTMIAGDLSNGYYATQLAVGPTATTTSITASPATPTYGQTVTLTASVTPALPVGDPTGTVTFTDTTTNTALGTAAVSSGVAQLTSPSLGVGTHSISVSYSGDANFGASSATATVTVNKAATKLAAAAATKTAKILTATLTRSDNGGAVSGQMIVFSTRNPSKGTQDVVCTAVTNSSGSASCKGAIPSADNLWDTTYTATYSASANYLGSTATASLAIS